MVSFPSRTLARAWAVACGVDPERVVLSGVPGAWCSVPGPAKGAECLFCLRLGECAAVVGVGCGFTPGRWWPVVKVRQLGLWEEEKK